MSAGDTPQPSTTTAATTAVTAPVAVLSDAEYDAINDELAGFAGQLNLVNARLTATVAELLANGGWEQGAKRTPSAFLQWKLGLSPHRADTIVRVAKRRHEYPALVARFDAGDFSLEQVDAAMAAPAWADAMIIDIVEIATVDKIRRAMRSNNFEGDPDAPELEAKPPADRVSFGVGRDGRWRIRGEFGIDDGHRIQAALTERKDALFINGDEDVTWADATLDCFDRSLGAVESASRRDHYRTWIHLDVTDGVATTTDGWRIPQALSQRLLCDGAIQPVWESEGIPFSVGTSQRIVPDRTRRIVELRDRGCRVPGCSADRFVEIHHIWHWSDGGPTDTWNLISLCPRHHKLHHLGQLGITGNADEFDGVVFTDTHGNTIDGRAKPATGNGPPQPNRPYRPPLAGRWNWNWIGLGWTHPNALRHRQQLAHNLPPAA